jgi:AraC-like DNA-binding protein
MDRLKMESDSAYAVLSPIEVRLIADTAYAFGIPYATTLDKTGLTQATLSQDKHKTSMQQFATSLGNAARAGGDRLLALRAGSRTHLTAFGIVGYALWSSGTLREALAVARDYAPLLNMKCGPILSVDGDLATLRFEPGGLDIAEMELCVEFELAKVLTFLRALQMTGFRPSSISLLSTSEMHHRRSAILLDCNHVHSDAIAGIAFDASWLDSPLPQADPRTHRACRDACDQLLEAQDNHVDLASAVRSILLNASTSIPTLPEVARTLCMSARTLRRRLDLTNTSYSQLVDDMRKTLALRYVGSTCLTTEAIAEKLGYSDAANFSHAFKRWTGQPPRQYRATSTISLTAPRESLMAVSGLARRSPAKNDPDIYRNVC